MEDAQDEGACKGRYGSRIFIVRSFGGERPRPNIRTAANRDLPKLGSACAAVVIARESES
jgi:hypothetical protein